MEAFEDLLPKYLRFMKGVVESSDLPLNISRELLQQDRNVSQMKKSLTKKVLDSLLEMFNQEKDMYKSFWKEFGNALKEGIISDFENREKIIPLLLFESTNDAVLLTNLDDYIGRMKEGQNEIYYLTGESRNIVENSPHLEALKEKGYEVLFLLNPVDEIMTQYLTEYKGKKIKSAGKGELDLGSKEEKEKSDKELKDKQGEFGDLLKYLGQKLDKYIKEVRLSNRLVTAPACIIGEEYDISPYLEKIIKKESEPGASIKKRILELNPQHSILSKMKARFIKDQNDPILADYAELLLGYALLAEGADLPDPVRFNHLVVDLMERSL